MCPVPLLSGHWFVCLQVICTLVRWLPFLFCLFSSCRGCWSFSMDSVWIERLTDERPGLCFLTEYSRALRLLSGISSLGCIRARQQALRNSLDSRFRNHVLSEPRVREFLYFLGEFSAKELPMVFEVIRQHLFPDAPTRCLFRAASLDPRAHPVESLISGSWNCPLVRFLLVAGLRPLFRWTSMWMLNPSWRFHWLFRGPFVPCSQVHLPVFLVPLLSVPLCATLRSRGRQL